MPSAIRSPVRAGFVAAVTTSTSMRSGVKQRRSLPNARRAGTAAASCSSNAGSANTTCCSCGETTPTPSCFCPGAGGRAFWREDGRHDRSRKRIAGGLARGRQRKTYRVPRPMLAAGDACAPRHDRANRGGRPASRNCNRPRSCARPRRGTHSGDYRGGFFGQRLLPHAGGGCMTWEAQGWSSVARDYHANREAAQGQALPFRFVLPRDITLQPKAFLIDGFVGTAETSAWYGPPDGGKSTVVLDAGC